MYNYFWVIELIKVQKVNRLCEFSQGKMPGEGRFQNEYLWDLH